MNDFVYELKKYFQETAPEKILEDWKKSECWDDVGITFDEFIQNTNDEIKNQDKCFIQVTSGSSFGDLVIIESTYYS
jgi:hypothetical protein